MRHCSKEYAYSAYWLFPCIESWVLTTWPPRKVLHYFYTRFIGLRQFVLERKNARIYKRLELPLFLIARKSGCKENNWSRRLWVFCPGRAWHGKLAPFCTALIEVHCWSSVPRWDFIFRNAASRSNCPSYRNVDMNEMGRRNFFTPRYFKCYHLNQRFTHYFSQPVKSARLVIGLREMAVVFLASWSQEISVLYA